MKNYSTKLFNLTFKKGVTIGTKSNSWKLFISEKMPIYQYLLAYTENNTKEEVEELLATIYHASCNMFIDMKLAEMVRDYYLKKIEKSSEKVEEVSDRSEENDIKSVKENG